MRGHASGRGAQSGGERTQVPLGGLVDRVDTGDGTELDEDVAHVPLDGGLGQRQPRRDLAVAHRLADEREHLTLARGQRVGQRPRAHRPQALPADAEHHAVVVRHHGLDRDHQFLPVRALQQVSAHPGAEQRLHELGPLVHAQDDDPRPGRAVLDLPDGAGDLAAGDLHIEQNDIRLLVRRQGHRCRAVADLADHPHVLLRFQDPAQALAYQRVVVDHEDGGGGPVTHRRLRCRTRRRRGGGGRAGRPACRGRAR